MRSNYIFWIKWLKAASVIVVAFGFFMAISALLPNIIFEFFNQNIDPSFFKSEDVSKVMKDFQSWQYGVGASMLVSWGIIIFFLSNYPLEKKEKWAWKAVLFCLIGWFLIDETISLYYKVYFNAIFNLGFLLIFLIPLLFIRKDIK